jgi:hypothetical protein
MVTLMLTLSLVSRSVSVPPGNMVMHAEVIRYVSVAQADLDLATEVARSLLGSASIAIEWHDCDARAAACDPSNGVVSIDVRLIAAPREGHDDACCGAVVPDPRGRMPVVLVYLPAID